MVCIRDLLIKFSLIVLVSHGLSACTSMQKLTGDKDEKGQKGAENVTSEADGQLVLIPNPYLEQKVKLPSGAKKDFEAALKLIEAKKWAEAELALIAMGEMYPKLSGPYVNLGIVHAKQEKYEDAAQAFTFAIELNKFNIDAYNHFGVTLRQQGRFEEAEKVYLQALEIWPHSPDTHKNLGVLYDLYMGRFEDAIKHYEMCQKVSAEPSRQIKGWIADLKRRMKKRAG